MALSRYHLDCPEPGLSCVDNGDSRRALAHATGRDAQEAEASLRGAGSIAARRLAPTAGSLGRREMKRIPVMAFNHIIAARVKPVKRAPLTYREAAVGLQYILDTEKKR